MGVLPWSNQLVKVPKGKEKEIKWPQGTTFLQCKRAKTGHMMMPVGNFNKYKTKKGDFTVKAKPKYSFTAETLMAKYAAQQQEMAQPSMSYPSSFVAAAR
jgi:hypothetical protein